MNPAARDDRRTRIVAHLQQQAGTGAPPSLRDIGAAVGLSTPSAVAWHVEQLAKHGIIRLDGIGPHRRIVAVTDTCMSCGQHLPEEAR